MCFLKIFSSTTSFKQVSALKDLPVYSLHDKGEIRKKRTGEVYKQNRVSLNVSEAEWDCFPQQVSDAVDFLTRFDDPLRKLLNSSDDIDAFLDFPIWSRLSSEIVNQNDHLPKELIKLCGSLGIGIEMALYSLDAFEDTNTGETQSG